MAIVKNPYRSGWRLVVLVLSLVGLFGSFALIMYGEDARLCACPRVARRFRGAVR